MVAVKMEGANNVEFHAVHIPSVNHEMTESLAQLSPGLSTGKQETISDIDERNLPTLEVTEKSFSYPTMLMRLLRSNRNCQMLCETPEE